MSLYHEYCIEQNAISPEPPELMKLSFKNDDGHFERIDKFIVLFHFTMELVFSVLLLPFTKAF